MKKRIYAVLAAFLTLAALSGCGSGGEVIDYNLVFINNSDATIVEVVTDSAGQSSGTRNADNSPLKRGETFGFEVGVYPVTVLVYDMAVGRIAEGELARIVITEAPRSGERWYVTAKDGTHGIVLTADTKWPEGA
ncbi:MAG: hypothetical protein HDT33_09450 [Clostridiales bacterium]|nr:hypothetical protein [Clostridiales bacterium]